jgi:hypothetical protein
MADHRGAVAILFRTAASDLDRDLALAASQDHGIRYNLSPISPWRIKTCPMSRAALTGSPSGLLAAWETDGQVYYARLDPREGRIDQPVAPPGEAPRKHPALAVNGRGEALLAWTEGTSWMKGGDLVWQIFDAEGRPNGAPGRVVGGIPTWGVPAVVARPDDGTFLLVH